MSESVILHTPLLLALYGAALALTLLEKRLRAGAVLPWAAAILAAVASALSVILGAGLRETAAAAVLLVIVNLTKPKGDQR